MTRITTNGGYLTQDLLPRITQIIRTAPEGQSLDILSLPSVKSVETSFRNVATIRENSCNSWQQPSMHGNSCYL